MVGVNTSPQRRRPRPWWRSRRLITAVICVDLLGAGALAYALTRPADRPAAVATNALAGARSPPASASTPSAAASTSAPTHRRSGQSHLPQATSLPKPSGSRTAVLPAGANTDTGAGASSALKANAQASFARLQSRLGSQARIAIAVQPLGLGSMQVLGGDPAMQAMSTSKILILSALLSDKGGIHNFTPEQMSSARAAITQSDNSAILVLFSDLQADKRGLLGASAYATTLLRKGRRPSDTGHNRATPAGVRHNLRTDPMDPKLRSKVLPSAGAGLRSAAIRRELRARVDAQHHTLREFRPRIRRVRSGRFQGRLGTRAQWSIRRPANRDHRRRHHRHRCITNRKPRQHVRSRPISARPSRPMAARRTATHPAPAGILLGMNPSSRQLNATCATRGSNSPGRRSLSEPSSHPRGCRVRGVTTSQASHRRPRDCCSGRAAVALPLRRSDSRVAPTLRPGTTVVQRSGSPGTDTTNHEPDHHHPRAAASPKDDQEPFLRGLDHDTVERRAGILNEPEDSDDRFALQAIGFDV